MRAWRDKLKIPAIQHFGSKLIDSVDLGRRKAFYTERIFVAIEISFVAAEGDFPRGLDEG
jgi:hypothetical protein